MSIDAPTASPTHAPKADPKTKRILAASEQLFLERGYATTSMDSVSLQAGVSKTTLYTRFASKADLFVATIEAVCKRHGADFPPDALADLPLEEALFRAGRSFVDLLWSPEGIKTRHSVLSEALRLPEVGKLYFQAGPGRIVVSFTALFEHLARHGSVRIDDPAFSARQFLATLLGDTYHSLELGLRDYPSEEERDAFTRAAVALFVRGIRNGTS